MFSPLSNERLPILVFYYISLNEIPDNIEALSKNGPIRGKSAFSSRCLSPNKLCQHRAFVLTVCYLEIFSTLLPDLIESVQSRKVKRRLKSDRRIAKDKIKKSRSEWIKILTSKGFDCVKKSDIKHQRLYYSCLNMIIAG